MRNYSRVMLFLISFMFIYQSTCYSWGGSHYTITRRAIEILPEADKNFLVEEAGNLINYYPGFPDINWGWYGGFGAWASGPDEPRYNDERRYYNISFYCGWDPVLQKGKGYVHAPPDSYECSPIYLEKAVLSFAEGRLLDGASFLGVLLHYIQDSGSFPHYQKLHRCCEDGMDPDKIGTPDYKPGLLGATLEEAKTNLRIKLEQLVKYTETYMKVIETRVDNKEKIIPEFVPLANACVRLCADAIHTTIELSGKPEITEFTTENPVNENLIFNPDFEEEPGDFVPDGWVAWYYNRKDRIGRAVYENRTKVARDRDVVKSGKSAVKLMWTPEEGIEWRQRWPYAVPVKEGESYRVSGWIRTMKATGNNCLAVFFHTTGSSMSKEIVKSKSLQGDNNWQEVALEVVIPTGIKRISLACRSEGNEGAVFFDDVKLVRLSSPSPEKISAETPKPSSNKKEMVLDMPFNEGDGLPRDRTTYGNHPVMNTAKWRIGSWSSDLQFDKGYVKVPHSASLDITDEITLIASISPSGWGDKGHGRIMEKRNKNSPYCWILTVAEGIKGLSFAVGDTGYNSNPNCTELGKWYHVAVTYDKKYVRFYVNSIPAGESAGTNPIRTDASADITIGADDLMERTFSGRMKGIKVYNYALTPEEITSDFRGVHWLEKTMDDEDKKTTVRVSRNYFEIDKENNAEILLKAAGKGIEGNLSWQIFDKSGQMTAQSKKPVNIQISPDKVGKIPFSFTPAGQVEYQMKISLNNNIIEEIPVFGMFQDPGAATGELNLKGILKIDCTEELGKDRFVDAGTSKVINSPIGSYREGGSSRRSRFAYKLVFPKTQVPYLISVTYPDDKPRTFEINYMIEGPNASIRDAERGIMSGDEYPVENRFKEHRFFIWPSTKEGALVFMTLEDKRPAAVKSIEIYEIVGERLPKLEINSPKDLLERQVGIYFEDPTFFKCFGLPQARSAVTYNEYPVLVDRFFDYLDYTGQNLFMYPVIFYEGPGFPSRVEPYNAPFYGMWARHPYNFFEYLLRRAEKRDITLFAIANFMEIPTLKLLASPNMKNVLDGKEDTIYGLDYKNRINYSWGHSTFPVYNLLHPVVRQKMLDYLKDLVDYYADYASFGGLALRIHESSALWMGDITTGYNDIGIKQFEKETGITVPVADNDPDRFSKRYNWLMENKKEEWTNWRGKKVTGIYIELADYMKKRRPDMTLVFTFVGPWQKRTSVASGEIPYTDYLRGGGIDINLLKNLDNINFQFTLFPSEHRFFAAGKRGDDAYHLMRFKPGIYESFPKSFSVNMHDTYWEDDIGKKNPLADYWYEERPWRVSVTNPPHPYVLENYAVPLLLKDYELISKGGYSIGTTAIEDAVRKFSSVFRTIPKAEFSDIYSSSEHKIKIRGWRNYFYIVNGSTDNMKLKVVFTEKPEGLINLTSGESCETIEKSINLTLSPYEIASFRSKVKSEIKNVLVE